MGIIVILRSNCLQFSVFSLPFLSLATDSCQFICMKKITSPSVGGSSTNLSNSQILDK